MITARVGTTVIAAYLSHDVNVIIVALIAVEIARLVFMGGFLWKARLLIARIDLGLVREQLKFVVPLGLAAVVFYVNQQMAQLATVTIFGVEALAIFGIGAFKIPMVRMIRSSVSDVVFPEMAQQTSRSTTQALHLWKRANVVYAFMIMPTFVVFMYYADTLITTLFTDKYVAAIPVFRIYLLFYLRQFCEVGTPLRAMNRNQHFVFGNILSCVCNLVLLWGISDQLGLIGPAIAFVVSDVILALYLGRCVIRAYDVSFSDFLLWRKVGKIALASVVCVPLMIALDYVDLQPVVRAIVGSLLYCVVFFLLVRRGKIEEVDLLTQKVVNVFRRLRVSTSSSM
jgi:O-antigen/teichoic acid export membrane protein